MNEYMKVLGLKVRDKVTGFVGVASSICFDLYGCVQVVITPQAGKDGKQEDGRWFDHKRLVVVSKSPVMEIPEFAKVAGAAKLPPPRQ